MSAEAPKDKERLDLLLALARGMGGIAVRPVHVTHSQLNEVEVRETFNRVEATGALLRKILDTPNHRRQWVPHANNIRSQGLNMGAVCRVIESHVLRSSPDTNVEALNRKIRRALSGKTLTPGMLECIISAFEINAANQEQLWELFSRNDH